MNAQEYIAAIDYGTKRVGVAIAHSVAQLPRPLVTLVNDNNLFGALIQLFKQEQVGKIIVGLPRGMDGGYTEQTRLTESFAAELRRQVTIPVYLVDETLTSIEAEGKAVSKAGLDADAAAIILNRYFTETSHEVVR